MTIRVLSQVAFVFLVVGVAAVSGDDDQGQPDLPADMEVVNAEASARAAYDAAGTAATEAETAVGPLQIEASKADTAYADARRIANEKRQQATRANDLAGEPGVKELQQAQAAVPAAIAALDKATQAKPPLDAALAAAKEVALPLQTTYEAAEKSAREAEIIAKNAFDAANQLATEAKAATSQAAAKRRAADAAQAALTQTLRIRQLAENRVSTIAQELAELTASAAAVDSQNHANAAAQQLDKVTLKKKMADDMLANIASKLANAEVAASAEEQSAQEFAKIAEEKEQAVALATAQRKAVADAAAALAQAQQTEVEAATLAHQQALDAAGNLVELDAASSATAADAATKREAANLAKAALDPVQQTLERARNQANAANQTLARAEAQKKAAEEGLANLEAQIAAAKVSHIADEEAAIAAETAALPLQAEADRTRTAHTEAVKVAFDNRAVADQAKTALYRIVANRKVATVMESAEPPQPAGQIDEIVFAKLKSLGLQPTLCSDAVFIRRAYLDLTGTLPPADEARTFIQEANQNKRIALVDRLLDQTAHVHYWTMKWCDILRVKAEFPVKLWPNAAQAYHRWVWESIARNKPYDQFARELLTSSGSNYRIGPVNFYRAIQDNTAGGIASSVGLVLLGTRVDFWPEERRTNLEVFFSQVGYKPTSEWKEEIVFWDPLHSTLVPGSIAPGIDSIANSITATNQIAQTLAEPLTENGPLEVVFPDGSQTTLAPDRDPRQVFADWLVQAENPWFTKAIVNRTWAWAMGRGIIHEADDIRDDNLASIPELLSYLEQDLVAHSYDIKHLKRQIFTSTTYQFSSIPRVETPEAIANFASYPLRRIEAEVLIDAVNGITGSSDLYTSAVPEPFTYIPKQMTAVALADGSVTSSFLTLFGRSARATGLENERVSELASPQWLHMLNSTAIQNKLQSGPTIAAIASSDGKPEEIAEQLYLTVLSRFPTEGDIQAAKQYAESGVTNGRDVWLDLTWALLNSPEFLMRH